MAAFDIYNLFPTATLFVSCRTPSIIPSISHPPRYDLEQDEAEEAVSDPRPMPSKVRGAVGIPMKLLILMTLMRQALM